MIWTVEAVDCAGLLTIGSEFPQRIDLKWNVPRSSCRWLTLRSLMLSEAHALAMRLLAILGFELLLGEFNRLGTGIQDGYQAGGECI